MAKPQVTFEYSALRYLNMWLETDRDACLAFKKTKKNDQNKRLQALARFVSEYSIDRTLRLKHDVKKGKPRYAPLLEIIDQYDSSDFRGGNLFPIVQNAERKIAKAYGTRTALSATTKCLWLKVQYRIIIYDSQVRKALGTKEGDYATFCDRWLESFREHRPKIEAVCTSLTKMCRYSIDPDTAEKYIASVSSKRWFQNRVFDIYLWSGGRVT
jgi:hypothetical protein